MLGPTTVRLLDLPLYGHVRSDRPQLLVAATGGTAWRRADLTVSYDGGTSWKDAGATSAPAVMGRTLNTLAPGGSALIDTARILEVELLDETMWLEARSDAALVGGANLALVGNELIQFGEVEPLGDGRFRVSRLLRGRRGTEWAAKEHRAGEDFVLIEAATLSVIEPPLSLVGSEVRLLATGVGEEEGPATAHVAVTGEALRPPAPVHLQARRTAAGDVAITWVRRSRSGWDWITDETPLGEESESYRLSMSGPGATRRVSVSTPSYVYTAAEQAADGLPGRAVEVEVVQVGTTGVSRPSAIVVL